MSSTDEEPQAPAPPPEPPPAPPPPEPPAPEAPAQSAAGPRVDWRIAAAIGAVLALIALVAVYFATRPDSSLPADAPTAADVADEEWPGLDDQDRLLVRPVSIPRPVISEAMQATMLSGYADIEFTVGANGKASDIRVLRESARDVGYGAEARRLVGAATWPTEWRGRTAPYGGQYRVIFPPGRNAGRPVPPLSMASPNLTPEILALRRDVTVTLFVRVDASGAVESARIVEADVQNDAVLSEAMRVAMGARFPPNPADFSYETPLTIRFDVLAAIGQTEEAPVGPVVTLSEVPFTQRPSAGDFGRHYPRRALQSRLDGRVTLNCVVQRNTRLDCVIIEEDPPGQGFGQAAMRLSRVFRAARQFPDGRTTVGAQVRVPLVFRSE